MEDKQNTKPKRNIRKWVFRVTYWLLAVLSIVPVSVLISEMYQQKNQNVKVNPEIKTLTEYERARNSKLPIEIAELQAREIINVADYHKLPVELIVGIVEKESLFNPFSISSVGAAGLMQVYKDDGVTITEENKYNIHYGLQIGCIILKHKLKIENGDLTKALDDYSGRAKGYAEGVYSCIGRYIMFKNKKVSKEIQIVEN